MVAGVDAASSGVAEASSELLLAAPMKPSSSPTEAGDNQIGPCESIEEYASELLSDMSALPPPSKEEQRDETVGLEEAERAAGDERAKPETADTEIEEPIDETKEVGVDQKQPADLPTNVVAATNAAIPSPMAGDEPLSFFEMLSKKADKYCAGVTDLCGGGLLNVDSAHQEANGGFVNAESADGQTREAKGLTVSTQMCGERKMTRMCDLSPLSIATERVAALESLENVQASVASCVFPLVSACLEENDVQLASKVGDGGNTKPTSPVMNGSKPVPAESSGLSAQPNDGLVDTAVPIDDTVTVDHAIGDKTVELAKQSTETPAESSEQSKKTIAEVLEKSAESAEAERSTELVVTGTSASIEHDENEASSPPPEEEAEPSSSSPEPSSPMQVKIPDAGVQVVKDPGVLSPSLSVFCEEVQFQEPAEPTESSPELAKHDELSPSHSRNRTSSLLHKTKVNGSSFLSKSFSKMSEEKKRFSRSKSRAQSKSRSDVQTDGNDTVNGNNTFPAKDHSSKKPQEKKPLPKPLPVKKSLTIPSSLIRLKTSRSKSSVKATTDKETREVNDELEDQESQISNRAPANCSNTHWDSEVEMRLG